MSVPYHRRPRGARPISGQAVARLLGVAMIGLLTGCQQIAPLSLAQHPPASKIVMVSLRPDEQQAAPMNLPGAVVELQPAAHVATEPPAEVTRLPEPSPYVAGGEMLPLPFQGDAVERLPAPDFSNWPRPEPMVADEARWRRVMHSILRDHQLYYSRENLALLTAGFGAGAIMANTVIDEHFRDFYQTNVRDAATDEFYEALHLPKYIGQGVYPIATYSAAMLAGSFGAEGSELATVGDWGERSLRGILVGGPPMLLMQQVTGGSRPGENSHSSHWHFWNDNNGVSGHAFMGAIPFITAAQLSDRWAVKGTFYFLSSLTGLSRINDDAHYLSQVTLGWWMAYLACRCVSEADEQAHSYRLVPWSAPGTSGVAVEWRY